MDGEPTPEELRSARRFALAVRAAIYGTLVVAGAVVLVMRFGGTDVEAQAMLGGTTSQDERFVLGLNREGAPVRFDTGLRAWCDGRPWDTRWWPTHGAPVDFERDGRAFAVREVARSTAADGALWTVTYRLGGAVEAGARSARGRMRVDLRRSDAKGGTAQRCASGWVAWRVRLPRYARPLRAR